VKLIVLGLSLSSSWGNGHATTFRALLKAFAARGHDILFLERDMPWYRENRDVTDPGYCRLEYYGALEQLNEWRDEICSADAVIVGSYVPDGVAVARYVQKHARGVTAFYDIDTPVTLAKLERGDFEYLSPEVIPAYGVYLSFTGGPTLERIEWQYGSPMARALYCSVDPEAYPLRPDVLKKWDLTYLGTYSDDRQPTLEKLLIEPARRLPQLRFCVAGPQYPDSVDWPANVERIEHLPPAEHAAFYAASRWTLNVTRADMIEAGWSPSVRLFEAAACATPVISDKWAGIESVLGPGREIVLAETAEEVARQLISSSKGAEIGCAARARILSGHTADHRASELERHIRDAATKGGSKTHKEQSVTCDDQKLALVTGGAGFIGSNLCDRLIAEGATVVCLDNLQTGRSENLRSLESESRFEFVQHDVVDDLPHRLRGGRTQFTHIYHLACAASPPHYQADPEHTMLTNVLGTRNLLRLAEETGARLLLTSTSEVYGDPEAHPQTEDYRGWVNCTGPRACYDEGKRAAETLAFDFLRARRADVRVARIFNTYGPRMRCDDGRVVSNFVCQALSGADITVYGDGSQTRSFCYIDDMVDGLSRLMDSDRAVGMPVNLGNPNELTVKGLIDLIVARTGTSSKIAYHDLPEDDPRRRKPDISRAFDLLAWEPKVDLEQGLDPTITWFAQEQNRMARPMFVDAPLVATAAE
jgi:nucleoside-diphosphate-sugar epimerase/spore maturation protein CgeB